MSNDKRLWRWRSSPLRRREDVIEAWIVLTVWLVVVIVGGVAAYVTDRSAEHEFAEQRAHRHAVSAVLLNDARRGVTSDWSTGGRVQGAVRWEAPDGSARTGQMMVDSGLKAGAQLTVWQDDRGRLSPSQPTGRGEGHVEAALFGGAAALAVAAPVLGAGALARARLDRRRLARWDREWDLVGPQWDRRTG
ncbi:Rv1733c family protein [Streptomyces collinus]